MEQGPRLSNVQWYLNRSKHVAYMAFLIPANVSTIEVAELIADLSTVFPRLDFSVDLSKSQYFEAPNQTPSDMAVEKLTVLPSDNLQLALGRLIDTLVEPFEPGQNPAFHCSLVPLEGGNSTLLFFSAPHAAIEGIDTFRLDGETPLAKPITFKASLVRVFLAIAALPSSILQIVLAPLLAKPRNRFSRRIVAVDRKAFRALAKQKNVSWQGLLYAVLLRSDSRSLSDRLGFPRLLAATVIPQQKSMLDDASVSFRMRFGLVRLLADLDAMAIKCDEQLFSGSKPKITLYHFLTAGLSFHRRFAAWFPVLYPERSFQYFPGGFSFSVTPPARTHRFEILSKPTFLISGSNTPGLKSCIVTPSGKQLYLSLNLPGNGSVEIAAVVEQLNALGVHTDVLV